jgi:hypothetical protein
VPATELTYSIRTVCLSGPRPWQAFVKGEHWPSEGRTGRYPSEGMAITAARRMCDNDASHASRPGETTAVY